MGAVQLLRARVRFSYEIATARYSLKLKYRYDIVMINLQVYNVHDIVSVDMYRCMHACAACE